MQLHEYTQYDALGLAQLIRDGQVQADELHKLALHALSIVNPQINAVVEHWPAESSPIARSAPFAGVPFLIKDIAVTMAGKRVEYGSRLAAGHVGQADSYRMTK